MNREPASNDALRMRRCRERQKRGQQCVLIEIDQSIAQYLKTIGLLAGEDVNSRAAIASAVENLLVMLAPPLDALAIPESTLLPQTRSALYCSCGRPLAHKSIASGRTLCSRCIPRIKHRHSQPGDRCLACGEPYDTTSPRKYCSDKCRLTHGMGLQ